MLAFVLVCHSSAAAEAAASWWRTNDVVAFVGGEDVVEMQRNGYLELLLTTATPDLNLRFRSLAFEGDTVFEQHRQLHFPPDEYQLSDIGATVVIAQFGQAEMLSGTNNLAQFSAAYDKMLSRFAVGGRRIVLVSPTPIEHAATPRLAFDPVDCAGAIAQLAIRRGYIYVSLSDAPTSMPLGTSQTRDGIHLNDEGQWKAARAVARVIAPALANRPARTLPNGTLNAPELEIIRKLILEKNRLWFDYWRPQNWAFLKGDRIEQPSSHDHRDPKKRWFPEEMARFQPLIEAKEQEIWKAAAQLR